MKTSLFLSALLNASLATALGYVLLSKAGRTTGIELPLASHTLYPSLRNVQSPVVPQTSAHVSSPSTWSWSQIESSDYPTYIANLRGVGCPEQTIRDIISADVHSLYASRRKELEARLSLMAAGEREAAAEGLNNLSWEESAVLAKLLGEQPIAVEPSLASVTRPRRIQVDAPRTEISLPLVLQDVDVQSLHLDPGQIAGIEELRQRFIQKIGGVNEDPQDPAYRERWIKAQGEIDDMMSGMIGSTAWADYQVAAHNQAVERSSQNR